MATSPTQRTLKLLADEGYHAEIVEKWIPGAKIRKDLFGFIDVLGIHKDNGQVIAVQTTSDSNFTGRIKKIREHENRHLPQLAGWTLEVHGWGKKGPRGKRKLWQVRREVINFSTEQAASLI